MRKGQQAILDMAKKHKYSDIQIALLSREDLTIEELKAAYFYMYRSKASSEDLAAEINMVFEHIRPIRKTIGTADDYSMILSAMLPDSYFHEDPLRENKKKLRILKMHLFIQEKYKDDNDYLRSSRFWSYVFALERNMSPWHQNILIKNVRSFAERNRIIDIPCLLDDFIFNKEKSLVYHLLEKGALRDLDYKSNILSMAYDSKSHRFLFNSDEFDDYLIEKDTGENEKKLFLAKIK